MTKRSKKLQIQHLDTKISTFIKLRDTPVPPNGWIRAIRTALGMSLKQLGNRLYITKQSAQNLEKREKEGAVTIKALREAANAMDMVFVYGFVPKEGSLEKLIESKAEELATEIVMRTSNTMRLEDQENSEARIKQAIKEQTAMIAAEQPKILWE